MDSSRDKGYAVFFGTEVKPNLHVKMSTEKQLGRLLHLLNFSISIFKPVKMLLFRRLMKIIKITFNFVMIIFVIITKFIITFVMRSV